MTPKAKYRASAYGKAHEKSYGKHYNKTKRVTPSRPASWQYAIKFRYGLTPEDIADAIVRQKGLCAICGKPPGISRAEIFVIDHCPISKKFRGLIHEKENRSLGILGDTADSLKKVLTYLTRDAASGITGL